MINHEAVYNTHANAVSIRENIAYDINNEVVVLDESAISTEATRLQGVYDGQAYARLRKAKYDLLNQDEMRYDDTKNSTTTWVDAIDAIKVAHPKP